MPYDINWLALSPMLAVVALGLLTMLLTPFMEQEPRRIGYFSLAGLIASALLTAGFWAANPGFSASMFGGSVVVDSFALFFYVVLLVIAAVSVLSAIPYLDRDQEQHGEFYAIMYFCLLGMMVMVSSTDLISLFLGFETMSLALYVLVGYRRHVMASNEAALKYYFLGAFAAAIFIYGIALVYGTVGSTSLAAAHAFFAANAFNAQPLASIGALMILVAVGFKIAAFPFHMWTPDVYEGAPTPVTGFMATAVKTAAFGLLIRLFTTMFAAGDLHTVATNITWWLAVLTMFTGNVFALAQRNFKRMLAYSGIAHTGYLLAAITALPDADAGSAILYYLVAYSFTNLGALACIAFLNGREEQRQNIEDFAGTGLRYPLVGLGMAVFMFSLIGFPPTAGFFGKYYLFIAVIKAGYTPLVVIAIINSILSVYYYLRVLVTMFMKPASDVEDAIAPLEPRMSGATRWAIAYTAIAVVWAGIGTANLTTILPGAAPLLATARSSVAALFTPSVSVQTGMR